MFVVVVKTGRDVRDVDLDEDGMINLAELQHVMGTREAQDLFDILDMDGMLGVVSFILSVCLLLLLLLLLFFMCVGFFVFSLYMFLFCFFCFVCVCVCVCVWGFLVGHWLVSGSFG